MGSSVEHKIHIQEEIGCCIYKVPISLREVKKEAYIPLSISIGPIHHEKDELKEMEKQKHKYYRFFEKRLVNQDDLMRYKGFLEDEEQKIRYWYREKFTFNTAEFVEMILLDAVFIMELFLREAERREHRDDRKHRDDYLITQRCDSRRIQRDLLLLENQLPIIVLEKLYETVVPNDVKKNDASFVKLAHEYFSSSYPFRHSEKKVERSEWKKSLHFTDLVRNCCLSEKQSELQPNPQKEECYVLRTATKLNEAGISFEKVQDRSLLEIKFEKKRFFDLFLCLGCLPCCKLFKARFQVPQLRVDHTTECVLRNIIAFEQCHYPEKAYICNYVSLIDSLIHTKDDAELLVEKGIIVHELGSDKELATLVNGLCKHVVTNSSCYEKIIEDVNKHYNNYWKRAMGTLRRVYFRDTWRSTSTLVGVAVLIFTIFNFIRVTSLLF